MLACIERTVKKPAPKVIAAVVLVLGVFAGFVSWYLPFMFSLAWPSLVLARVGVPHSWVFSAVLIIGGITWLGFWSRRRAWSRIIIASLFIPALYCLAAFLFVAHVPVPLPAMTPYDSTPAQRTAYLQAYDSGYRDGIVGRLRTYCFYPEAETKGFYDGVYQGNVVWYRMFGHSMPEHAKQMIDASAGRDGVKLESK